MSSHEAAMPGWNLGVRLVLELGSFAALGWAGWQMGGGGVGGVLLATVLPLAAMVLWGTFAVPGDPSRSGKAPVPVSGAVRLAVEYAVFGGAVVALASQGAYVAAGVFAAVNVLHAAFGVPRLKWLLRYRVAA
ncbi:YrdB family protein [Yinghuangia soli]|uniref:YrdB family protein n=1 Tax=Yinghuangia soli TaxID=2908204 RepID=A0AA41Q0A8_9ACTN|nr:YrdB family protein [Yinghuangia soli]MCF2528956.1 YrdB family protein [Yinghuangia soli]